LTRRLKEGERETEFWKTKALDKGVEDPNKAATPATKSFDPSKKPELDDFEDHDEFLEALTDWKVEQKFEKINAENRLEISKKEAGKVFEAHTGRVAIFKAATPDFEKVMEDLGNQPVSTALRSEIFTSDKGAEILYALAKDHTLLKKLNGMGVVEVARAVGRLESTLTPSKLDGQKPVITPPPAPISKVSGDSGTASTSLDEMSYRDFQRAREREIAGVR